MTLSSANGPWGSAKNPRRKWSKKKRSKGLSADGIRTAAGNDFWLASTLRKILRNEKYIGDALLQKTVTTDFLTKKRVVNNGIVPQYYVEGSHEAIIRLSDCSYTALSSVVDAHINSLLCLAYEQSSFVNVPEINYSV